MPGAEPATHGPEDHPAPLAAATRQSLIVGLSTGLYGVSFGAIAVTSGLSVAQTQVLSLAMFSGGSQFALAGVLASGGSAGAGITTAALLATRLTFYGLRVRQFLAAHGLARPLAAQLTIDESTAVGEAQVDPHAQRRGFWLTGLTIYVGWNLMTLAGALAGNAIGDPRRWGLDAASSAAFLALLWPRLRQRPGPLIAALAVVIALGLTPFVRPGIPVVAAVGAVMAIALARPERD